MNVVTIHHPSEHLLPHAKSRGPQPLLSNILTARVVGPIPATLCPGTTIREEDVHGSYIGGFPRGRGKISRAARRRN